MRALSKLIVVLLTALSLALIGQEPPKGDQFVPPPPVSPQTPVDHGPEKRPGEVVPPPEPERPVETDAQAARREEIALRIGQLNQRWGILKLWATEKEPSIVRLFEQNPEIAAYFYHGVGEILAILKNLVGLPPHVFARPLTVVFDRTDPRNVIATIIDVKSELPLGTLTLLDGSEVKEFTPNEENIAAIVKVTPNRIALIAETSPEAARMAATAEQVYQERYRDNVAEGYFEQLAKDVLRIPQEKNNRQLFSEFVSGRNYAPGYNHNSTMIVFKDKQTGERLGIVGFHYDVNKPNAVRIVNFGLGPDVRGKDLLDDVKIKIHNAGAEARRAVEDR